MPLHKNDVIFAHVKGHFPWPARILEVKATSVKVIFFETDEVNNVIAKQTIEVTENTIAKMKNKYGLRDGFNKVIQKMKDYTESMAVVPQSPLKKSPPVVEKPEPEKPEPEKPEPEMSEPVMNISDDLVIDEPKVVDNRGPLTLCSATVGLKLTEVNETSQNGEENGCESSDDLTNGNSNQNGLKRSSEEETNDEPVEKKSKEDDKNETEEKTKFDYKEKRRKQKQEQKRRKRERKLKEEADNAEKEQKAQLLVKNDLNFKIILDGEKKATEIKYTDSEVKVNTPVVTNTDNAVKLNGIEKTIAVENSLLDEKKEKPKKKKKKVKGEEVTQTGVVSAVDVQQSESIVKMKKKKKKDKEKASKDHESATKIIKKKKNDKSKKMGSEGSDDKVEENGGNLIVGGEEHSAEVFEESDWDSRLKPGEVEIVLPNNKSKMKKYAESVSGAPKSSVKSTAVVEKPEPEVSVSVMKIPDAIVAENRIEDVSKLKNLVNQPEVDTTHIDINLNNESSRENKENLNPEEESLNKMDESTAETADTHIKYKPFQIRGYSGNPLTIRIPEKYLLSKPKTPNDGINSMIDMTDTTSLKSGGVDIHTKPSISGANLDALSPTKSTAVVSDLESDQDSPFSPELKRDQRPNFKLGKRKLSLTEQIKNLNDSMAEENKPNISLKKAKIKNELKKKFKGENVKESSSKGEKAKGISSKGEQEKGKPGNPYILFFNDNQARVKANNPKMNQKEISAALGREWATLKKDNGSKFLEYQEIYKNKLESYKATKLAKLNKLDNKENEAKEQVSELLNENEKLKMEVIELKQKNRDLEDKNTELKGENIHLKESNSNLKKSKEDAVTSFNQTKSILEKLLKNKKK